MESSVLLHSMWQGHPDLVVVFQSHKVFRGAEFSQAWHDWKSELADCKCVSLSYCSQGNTNPYQHGWNTWCVLTVCISTQWNNMFLNPKIKQICILTHQYPFICTKHFFFFLLKKSPPKPHLNNPCLKIF